MKKYIYATYKICTIFGIFLGGGWYLDKIIIKEGEDPESSLFYFPCDQWLDEGQGDKKIERLLDASKPPKQTSKNLFNSSTHFFSGVK